MSDFHIVDPYDFDQNIFTLIGKDWALISAYHPQTKTSNCMTASWGGMGILWNKPIFWCVIRPQRYTKEFVDQSDHISLSFFDETHRDALKICGSKSGRDCDKFSLAGFKPIVDSSGRVDYDTAKLTILGKKLYAQVLDEDCFVQPSILTEQYPNRDLHTLYVCEIEEIRVYH